jgi:H+/Cl- antiporter ClcA
MCESKEFCRITPALYAMVGAAAALGGVTRMTGISV